MKKKQNLFLYVFFPIFLESLKYYDIKKNVVNLCELLWHICLKLVTVFILSSISESFQFYIFDIFIFFFLESYHVQLVARQQ